MAELEAVRHGFLAVIDFDRRAVDLVRFDTRIVTRLRKPVGLHGRVVKRRQARGSGYRYRHFARNLRRDVVEGQRRDETNDGVGKTKANRDQVWLAERWEFHQPVNAPADQLDDTSVSQGVERVGRDPVADGLAHAKQTAVLTKDLFGAFLHSKFQINRYHILITGNNIS